MHHTRKLTDAQEEQAAEAYKAGGLIAEIAAEFGVGRKTINNALRRCNCPTRDKRESQRILVERRLKSGAAHPNFKGGRTKGAGGYVLVGIDSEDPMWPMAKDRGRFSKYGRGYVLEHRLVVARALGRPLSREETVHHRNGIRDDNRLENLQLMMGRHGKGAALRCADCGSQNIVGVELG